MANFNIGDKVKCIGMDDGYNGKLIVGQIYTILTITHGGEWLRVKEGYNIYEIKYFEPLKKEYKRNLPSWF